MNCLANLESIATTNILASLVYRNKCSYSNCDTRELYIVTVKLQLMGNFNSEYGKLIYKLTIVLSNEVKPSSVLKIIST